MKLSVLDQSPIRAGGTAGDALRETLGLAQLADRLGYERYWVAEHHSSGGLASATPEILIEAIASRTNRIRVGSGGVMLSHYSPLKVAESFRMLEALHPGRIDLGVGRAPGSDTRTAAALARGPGRLGIEHYPEQLMDLYGYLSDTLPKDHQFSGIQAMPAGETMPELWLLGSSPASAEYAAALGWSYCFAHFINPYGGVVYCQNYRAAFDASPVQGSPRVSLAVSATVADTVEEAERLCWSRWVWRVAANHGVRKGILSPEEAKAIELTPPEREYVEHMRGESIFGDRRIVKSKLEQLAADYGTDEIMVVTITHDFEARKRSYELLAEAFQLDGQASAPAANDGPPSRAHSGTPFG
jgi:luciferase family oxidoreductase group 1